MEKILNYIIKYNNPINKFEIENSKDFKIFKIKTENELLFLDYILKINFDKDDYISSNVILNYLNIHIYTQSFDLFLNFHNLFEFENQNEKEFYEFINKFIEITKNYKNVEIKEINPHQFFNIEKFLFAYKLHYLLFNEGNIILKRNNINIEKIVDDKIKNIINTIGKENIDEIYFDEMMNINKFFLIEKINNNKIIYNKNLDAIQCFIKPDYINKYYNSLKKLEINEKFIEINEYNENILQIINEKKLKSLIINDNISKFKIFFNNDNSLFIDFDINCSNKNLLETLNNIKKNNIIINKLDLIFNYQNNFKKIKVNFSNDKILLEISIKIKGYKTIIEYPKDFINNDSFKIQSSCINCPLNYLTMDDNIKNILNIIFNKEKLLNPSLINSEIYIDNINDFKQYLKYSDKYNFDEMYIELNDEEKKELFNLFNLKHIEFFCKKLKLIKENYENKKEIQFKDKLIENKRSLSRMIPILYVISNKYKKLNKKPILYNLINFLGKKTELLIE